MLMIAKALKIVASKLADAAAVYPLRLRLTETSGGIALAEEFLGVKV
jgi:hypothetical protein